MKNTVQFLINRKLRASVCSGILFWTIERNQRQQSLINNLYIEFFSKYEEEQDFAFFNKLCPVLFFYFIVELCAEMQNSFEKFTKFVGYKSYVKSKKVDKGSIFGSMVKNGLNKDKINEENITFKMVEKTWIDQKAMNSQDFNYKQVDQILAKIKEIMDVNPISNVEQKKFAFKTADFEAMDFGKFLGYSIQELMLLNRIRREMEKKNNFDKDFSENKLSSHILK
jgi:hypothetical protein